MEMGEGLVLEDVELVDLPFEDETSEGDVAVILRKVKANILNADINLSLLLTDAYCELPPVPSARENITLTSRISSMTIYFPKTSHCEMWKCFVKI